MVIKMANITKFNLLLKLGSMAFHRQMDISHRGPLKNHIGIFIAKRYIRELLKREKEKKKLKKEIESPDFNLFTTLSQLIMGGGQLCIVFRSDGTSAGASRN